jgi:hypothetical protein
MIVLKATNVASSVNHSELSVLAGSRTPAGAAIMPALARAGARRAPIARVERARCR